MAGRIRDLIATYREAEDLINIGAYAKGSNPKIDEAIAKNQAITAFLKQGKNEKFTMEETLGIMQSIVGK